MLKKALKSKKGAALEWAIAFGFVIFALMMLVTTSLFSLRINTNLTKKQSEDKRTLNQIGEYFVQSVKKGLPFEESVKQGENSSAFIDQCSAKGYFFEERCVKQSDDDDTYYRILKVDKGSNTVMTMIVSESFNDDDTSSLEIVSKSTNIKNADEQLSNKLTELGLTYGENNPEAFAELIQEYKEGSKCTVTFKNGDNTVYTAKVKKGDTIKFSDIQALKLADKTNELFVGWKDSATTYIDSYTPISKTVTLTPEYAKACAVTIKKSNTYGEINGNYRTGTTYKFPSKAKSGYDKIVYDKEKHLLWVGDQNVSAVPDSGYALTWTADAAKIKNENTINDNVTDITITITWKKGYTVSIQSNNTTGGSVSVTQIKEVPTGSKPIVDGTTLTLDGTTVIAVPNTGYECTGWTLNGSSISSASQITKASTVKADFAIKKFNVSVVSSGNGSVNKTSFADVPYGSAITVSGNTLTLNGQTVTATPGSGYLFEGWSVNNGDTITAATTITASFKPNNFDVTVQAETGGKVDIALVKDVQYGSKIGVSGNILTLNGKTITATPYEGYIFNGWSVTDGAGIADKVITAKFLKLHTVTISCDSNMGTVSQTELTVSDGSTVSVSGSTLIITDFVTKEAKTITATAKDRYIFSEWNVKNNTKITDNTQIEAKFLYLFTVTIRCDHGTLKEGIASFVNVPDGSKISSDGNVLTISNSKPEYSQTATVTANSGYKFTKWTVNGNVTSVTSPNVEVSAEFVQVFNVSVNSADTNKGTVDRSSFDNIPNNSTISINGNVLTVKDSTTGTEQKVIATPKQGYKFVAWNVTNNVTSVTSSGITVTATFEIMRFEVKFGAATGGTVNINSLANVPYGSTVSINGSNVLTLNGTSITPTANAGYRFNGWSVSNGYAITGGNVEIRADFIQLFTVSVNSNDTSMGTVNSSSFANVPNGSSISIADNVLTLNGQTVTASVKDGNKYVFSGWSVSDGDKVTGNITITANFELRKYNIVAESLSNASFTVSYNNTTTTLSKNGDSIQIPYSAKVTVTVSYGKNNEQSCSIKCGDTAYSSGSEFEMPAGDVSLTATSSSCIASGTLITLADGSQKMIEDITMEDKILVFNHETGKTEAASINFMEADGWDDYEIINLEWSNGQKSRIIYEHGFFDLDLMKYVYIHADDFEQYVGHRFYTGKLVDDIYYDGEVTLVKAYVTNEYVGCYSFPTVYHLNFYMEDMLSMPGGITGIFNIFDYGNDLKYDEKDMEESIAEFGLFDYENVAEYISYETFCKYPAQYLNVSLGKGLLTEKDLEYLIERYAVKYSEVLE